MSTAPGPAARLATPAARVWLALATVYLVWGSTYLAIRVMVETVPPYLGAGARFLLAGAGLWAFARVRLGPGAMRVTRRQLLACALIGTLLCAGGNGLVTVAETDVPSALAALLIASVPLWVAVLRFFSGDRPAPATAWGLGLGFLGVAILLMPGSRSDGAPLWGLLLILLAAALWATGSFGSSRVPLPRDPLVSTSWQMLLGGLFMIVSGIAAGEIADLHPGRFSLDSGLAFVYLVVIGSMLAYTAYVWALRNAPISKVATYAYVNPVVAVLLGWSILSESISATTLVGAGVIVSSVALVVRQEGRAKPVAARQPPAGANARSKSVESTT